MMCFISESFQRGGSVDNAVFLAAADKYKDMIFRVAVNYLGSAFDADDVVQDVLLRLYTYDKPFAGDVHLKNWLIRVTINVCKNILRSPWRKNRVNLDELVGVAAPQSEQQLDLLCAVMSLKEKYRTVLYLFYYEDYSVTQIASFLCIKESAVTTRLSRARNILRNGGFFDE